MTFLGKIRGMFGGDAEAAPSEEPLRNRTFSASQFRDAELARAADARQRSEAAKIDAAEVLSPAVNPVAETLMAADQEMAEPELTEPEVFEPEMAESAVTEPEIAEPALQESDIADPEFAEPEIVDPEFVEPELQESEIADPEIADPEIVEPEIAEPELAEPELAEPGLAEPEFEEPEYSSPVVPTAPAGDPMPWDEAVGWLSQRSAETRNFVGQYWNWDHDLRVLHFLAQQPDLDAGVGAHIFWLTAANEDVFPFGDDEPAGQVGEQVAWLTDFLGRRFAEGAFRPPSYGFDDSWDCERHKQHLADLYEEGRIDWSPEAIPASSQAELMSFDDIPEDERQEVTEFLARFGVY